MDTMKLTIINNSSLSGIPEEVIDLISFQTLNQANEILSDYDLKISEYEKVMDAGRLVEQKITLVDN
jgi:hypothetical protein